MHQCGFNCNLTLHVVSLNDYIPVATTQLQLHGFENFKRLLHLS